MNLTLLIVLNAALDLTALLAVLAIVRFTHRLHHHDTKPETIHPSQPLPLHIALPAEEIEELAEAA
jgi:hypothetical protein